MLAWLLGPASLLATSRGGSCAVQQQLRLLLGCDTMRIQQGAPAVQLGQRSGWLADCASSVAVAAKERQGRQSEGQVDAQPSQQHGGTQGQGGKGCKARQLLRQAAVALLDGCGGGACSRSQEGAAWDWGGTQLTVWPAGGKEHGLWRHRCGHAQQRDPLFTCREPAQTCRHSAAAAAHQ